MTRTLRWLRAVLAVLAMLPWSLLPYGESEDPASPHFNDMARLHSQRKMKQLWLTPQEILAHTETVWGDKERLKKYAARIP